MPPDILYFRPLVQFSHPLITQAQPNPPSIFHKYQKVTKEMNLTKKKLIPILVLFLSIISVLRILSLTIKTTSSSSASTSPSPSFSHTNESSLHPKISHNIITTFQEKEFKILINIISLKSPCNLLIFGFQPQFLILSSMNKAGSTVFLDDNHDRTTTNYNKNNTQIHSFKYNVPTKEAYKLLKHARNNPECAPDPRYLQTSKCILALKNLPAIVYEKNWDVILVDGPSGDSTESPGRMASIFTAGVLARSGNVSDVIVHDVNRMVEKWFSWEFLCDENLLYSKGKLWHFRIRGSLNSTTFCSVRDRVGT